MDKDLIAACQMFLVPATILFAAIGIARTEPLKTLISALGAVFSLIWFARMYAWGALTAPDRNTALSLAGTFFAASIISAVVHAMRWWRGESEIAKLSTSAGAPPG